MLRKKLSALLAFCFLGAFLATPVCAIPEPTESAFVPDEVISRNLYTNSTTTSLKISGGKATATAKANGYPGLATKISTSMYLERYTNGTWKTYGSWTTSVNGSFSAFQQTTSVSKGYSYRVKAVYYVYSGTKCEVLTGYSQTVKY